MQLRDRSDPLRRTVERLGAASTVVELIERSLAALHELIPSDSVIFDEVSLADGRTRGTTSPAHLVDEWAEMMPLFERWFMQSPNVQHFREHPASGARRWSDGDLEAFRETELYREFMAPLGIHHQLSFTLRGSADSQRAFVLNRSDRDFTDDEVRVCDELAPYLSALFATALQRAIGMVDGLNRSAQWAAFVVDQTGASVVDEHRTAAPYVTDGRLDPGISTWVRDRLAGRDLLKTLDPVDGQVVVGDGSAVTLQLLPDAAGAHVLILSEAPDHDGPAALRSLSPRQREVIRELVAGGTNQQISRRLGISVETVKKHLSAAYEQLGVNDRASAIARVRSRPSRSTGRST